MTGRDLLPPAWNVSRETEEGLEALAGLVARWTPRINLVSRASLGEIWRRHILDSAQVFFAATAPRGVWADLGSGGGFPGLVVATLARQLAPELRVTLVESDLRKAAFLVTAARELQLPAVVMTERAELMPPIGAGTLSARALAPLPELLALAARHLAADGLAIFPKGASWQSEVDQARKKWSFDLDPIPSITGQGGAVLVIKGLSRA